MFLFLSSSSSSSFFFSLSFSQDLDPHVLTKHRETAGHLEMKPRAEHNGDGFRVRSCFLNFFINDTLDHRGDSVFKVINLYPPVVLSNVMFGPIALKIGYSHDDVKDKTEYEKTQVSLRRCEKCECFPLAEMKGSGFDSIEFSQIEVAIPFNMIGVCIKVCVGVVIQC